MKRINISKLLLITLITLLLAMFLIVTTSKDFRENKTANPVISAVNDGIGWVDKTLGRPSKFFATQRENLGHLIETYEENAQLRKQVSELTQSQDELRRLKSENKDLKAALGLKNTLTNFETIQANVITRTPATWDDQIIVDAGKTKGLKKNQLVMGTGGVIGRVSQVSQTTAKVDLLTSENGLKNNLPVKVTIDDQDVYGLVSSYDSDDHTFVVTQLDSEKAVKKGTKVYTSGLGGGSASDLLVGEVEEDLTKSGENQRTLHVKPSPDASDIQIVSIILAKTGE
jgi:rod shape-determining protein MreC